LPNVTSTSSSAPSKQEAKWHKNYLHLVEFKRQNGHLQANKMFRSLGSWVSNQRQFHKKGLLREDRKQELNDIGFQWQQSMTDADSNPDGQVTSVAHEENAWHHLATM